ncbi:MAG: hypothetical protein IT204_04310 [Fimbriimonadaceae bacterium]|nr:hypothetical protein [Fimbriimonadaceae bacterium]
MLLEWVVHPARRRPLAVVGTVLYGGLVSVAVQLAFGHPLYTLIAAAAVLLAAGDFLLPAVYRLTATGARRDGWGGRRELTWEQVASVWERPDGLFLSREGRPSRVLPRGLLLLWGHHAEQVRTLVAQHATARRTWPEVAP